MSRKTDCGLEAEIYMTWLANGKKFKPTAKLFNKQPEKIRQTVARVCWKLKQGGQFLDLQKNCKND